MACRVRLRPVLMTSLATIIGLLPMALKLGAGSEAYAPLARAILGGLSVSVSLTVFLVPAAYLLVYEPGPQDSHALIRDSSCSAFSRPRCRRSRRCSLTLAEAQQLAIQNNPQISRRQVQRRRGAPGAAAVPGRLRADRVRQLHGRRRRQRQPPRRRRTEQPGGLQPPRLGSGGRPDDHGFRPHRQSGRDGQAAGEAQDQATETTRAQILLNAAAPISPCCARRRC